MTAKIIDGKKLAGKIKNKVANEIARLGRKPKLAVILVGKNPASEIYVRNKEKSCNEVGIESLKINLPSEISEKELIAEIDRLNGDKNINGILTQLPLPEHINEQNIINRIAVEKDVDGFHPLNIGKLWSGGDINETLVPCTPKACVKLLKSEIEDLSGKNAVIIGRSNIVGKPLAALLINENCSVTICHSHTLDLPNICRNADILIAAVGRAELVTAEFVKRNSVIIDVGINRVEIDGKNTLRGDVKFEDCKNLVAAITPVPGGVGPMTVACLLENTLQAMKLQN